MFMAENLIPLTTNILDAVGIGLWAVEIDEGCAPRMIANETMLKLLGLSEGVSGEDIFHAWFDNIDPEHFAEVKAYVDKMSAGQAAEIQYPWHSPDGRVRFVRCGGNRNFDYKKGVRLEGWHKDITELALIQKTAEDELRQEITTMDLDTKRERLQSALNEKLYGKAILDKAYSYFKVNLSEGNIYRPFIQIVEGKSVDVSESFGTDFPSYDAVIRKIADQLVDKEYRKAFVQHLSAKTLIDQFQKGDSIPEYTCRFYSPHIGWHYSRFVCYVSKNEILNEYQAMMVAYNVSEQQKQDAAIRDCIDVLYKENRSRDAVEELLSTLASFYAADRAYILESDKERQTLSSTYEWCRKGVRPNKADLQRIPIVFFKPWIDSVGDMDAVYLDSQNDEYGVWDRLYRELPVQDVKSISASTIVSDEERFGVLVLDNPKESQKNFAVLKLVAGFAENEINRRKRMDEDAAVTSLLASDYSCIFYCDLEADLVTAHKLNANIQKMLGTSLGEKTYSGAIDFIANKVVSPENVDFVIRKLSVKNLKPLLQKKGVTSFEYVNYADRFCECKVVAVNKKQRAFVIGFADKDEQIRTARMHQKKIEQDLEIIDILASEYSSVYYIDLEKDSITPYSMNKESESLFGSRFRSGVLYSKAFEEYVNGVVWERDRQMMREAGAIENIKRELSLRKTFITTYRGNVDGRPHYCEMKFVKVGNELDSPKAVALGFAEKDDLILKDFVNDILYDDYVSIYFVNVEDNSFRTIKSSNVSWVEKRPLYSTYSGEVKKISGIVSDDFKQDWLKLSNLFYVQKFLKDADQREQEFKIESGEWLRARFTTIERNEENEVVSFVLSFMLLSDDQVEKLELDAKIAEQNDLLEKQQVMLQKALSMAQSSDRAKTAFLSNMSHDIRTPMNAIVGFTGLAMAHIDEKDVVLDYLKKLGQSSNHLLSLINDVLDMSRIESGKMMLSENAEDLVDIIDTLKDIVQADVDAKHLEFEVKTDIHNSGIMCDKLRLNQVLLNVLSNAIKYTQAGGSVMMQVEEKESSKPGFAMFVFRISDNGMGMNEEFLKTIYEPFTRANSSTVSGIQGTGLGMSITKNIVEMMGGDIEIFSEENKGTEVILSIEFKLHYKNKEGMKNSVATSDFAGRKILLVEDNEMNRQIASDILADCGFVVFTAENGKEAVELIKKSMPKQYDLILMDVQMPIMDGFAATRAIRELPARYQSRIPIVAMTANAFEEDRKAALDAGMDEHISKPIDIDKMKYILSKFIKK
ncbi:Signal transduction histidine kinase [Fibrobacter sp. UWB11]|nr:Signal transduction histidine kinase [Fibrobacter sp. UWB11]